MITTDAMLTVVVAAVAMAAAHTAGRQQSVRAFEGLGAGTPVAAATNNLFNQIPPELLHHNVDVVLGDFGI